MNGAFDNEATAIVRLVNEPDELFPDKTKVFA